MWASSDEDAFVCFQQWQSRSDIEQLDDNTHEGKTPGDLERRTGSVRKPPAASPAPV